MSGSSSKDPKGQDQPANTDIQIASLVDLLNEQDAAMRSLFAKALNLYVSPGADAIPEKEKRDRLKRAIEESLNGEGTPC